MRKVLIFSFFILAIFTMVLPLQAEKYGKEEGFIKKEINRNERHIGNKLRTVFLANIKDKKLVFIRLTPGQFVATKIKGRLRRDKG